MSNAHPVILQAVESPDSIPEYIGDDAEQTDGVAGASSRIRRDHLLLDHFAALMGQEITLVGTNGRAPFQLVEGTEKPSSRYPGQVRMPFNLVFRSLNEATLGGAHYDLVHPDLGTVSYVMLTRTMVYPDQEPGIYYEATFN